MRERSVSNTFVESFFTCPTQKLEESVHTSLYAHTTSLIIPLQSASWYILRIYFSGSEISTCLMNNKTYNTTKKSISSKEKLDHSGNYLQQNIEAKIWDVGSWANVWTFGVNLHQKSHDTSHEI